MLFDTIIIGKGLIGSAAAKYLSRSQKQVAILGPDEPTDLERAIVFSSHYDQARIQRLIGTDAVWTRLNLQSVNEYASLQKESNIQFHTKNGCLYVNPTGEDAYLKQAPSLAKQFNTAHQFFENDEALKQQFPDYNFPITAKAMFESEPAGYINPRLLIKAQLSIVEKNKGVIINAIANEIKYHNGNYKMTTTTGEIYEAKKVLLAPGAFTNFLDLTAKKLAFTLKSETIILARLSNAEAGRLLALSSLLYEIVMPQLQNIYLIPPVQYPDGNYYIKMGCNLPEDIYFNNLQEVQHWFKNGDSDIVLNKLKDALMKIIPCLKAETFMTKRCIVTRTKHGKPYIGAINSDGLFVAAGGNGYSAMCSDALGKVAACAITDGLFPEGYLSNMFIPVFVE